MKSTLLTLFFIGITQFVLGQFAIGHTTIIFQDPDRGNRAIETEIYYPATSAGTDTPIESGAYPVIVFGHGFVMSWDAYENLWEEFVPRGYIMAFPRTEGNIFSTDHQEFGWDLQFLVGAMQAEGASSGSVLFGGVAPETALMGHSMGGGASFLAADSLCVNQNPYLKTLIGLAPAESTTNGVSSINSARTVTVPSLILSGGQDGVTPPADHHIPMYDSLASDCKTFINVLGGAHCYFANANFNCDFGESTSSTGISITRTEQHEITFDFVNLWLDYTLKGDCGSFSVFSDSLNLSPRVDFNQTCSLNPVAYNLAESAQVCSGDSYTFPDGTTTTNITAQTVHTSTLQTTLGCDSIIETTVSISTTGDASFNYGSPSYCVSGTDPTPTGIGTSGGTFSGTGALVINSTTGEIDLDASGLGTYDVTYALTGSCAASSTISITISAAQDASFTYDQSSYCRDDNATLTLGTSSTAGTFSATPAGLSIDASTGAVDLSNSQPGSYDITNTLAASGGCAATSATESITVIGVDTSLTVSGETLTSNQAGAQYQWLDCDNGNQPISGATSTSYTATANGNYAVGVTYNGCYEVSECVQVSGLGVADLETILTTLPYPNPAKGEVTIELAGENVWFQLMDYTGRIVLQQQLTRGKNSIPLELSSGIYVWRCLTSLTNVSEGKLVVK